MIGIGPRFPPFVKSRRELKTKSFNTSIMSFSSNGQTASAILLAEPVSIKVYLSKMFAGKTSLYVFVSTMFNPIALSSNINRSKIRSIYVRISSSEPKECVLYEL